MAYFANGTEGAVLDEQCGNCKLNHDAPCPVLLVQMNYNYDQCHPDHWKLREAMNCLVNDKGECQMKKCLDNYITPMRRKTDWQTQQESTYGQQRKRYRFITLNTVWFLYRVYFRLRNIC